MTKVCILMGEFPKIYKLGQVLAEVPAEQIILGYKSHSAQNPSLVEKLKNRFRDRGIQTLDINEHTALELTKENKVVFVPLDEWGWRILEKKPIKIGPPIEYIEKIQEWEWDEYFIVVPLRYFDRFLFIKLQERMQILGFEIRKDQKSGINAYRFSWHKWSTSEWDSYEYKTVIHQWSEGVSVYGILTQLDIDTIMLDQWWMFWKSKKYDFSLEGIKNILEVAKDLRWFAENLGFERAQITPHPDWDKRALEHLEEMLWSLFKIALKKQ